MTQEERAHLRRYCGEGRQGVWIPDAVSDAALLAFSQIAPLIDAGDSTEGLACSDGSLNGRQFGGAYRQPARIDRYHAGRMKSR